MILLKTKDWDNLEEARRLMPTINVHKDIYESILRNNPKEAKERMEKHVQSVYEAACDYLASVRKNIFSEV